jgi:hypothetical protein
MVEMEDHEGRTQNIKPLIYLIVDHEFKPTNIQH